MKVSVTSTLMEGEGHLVSASMASSSMRRAAGKHHKTVVVCTSLLVQYKTKTFNYIYSSLNEHNYFVTSTKLTHEYAYIMLNLQCHKDTTQVKRKWCRKYGIYSHGWDGYRGLVWLKLWIYLVLSSNRNFHPTCPQYGCTLLNTRHCFKRNPCTNTLRINPRMPPCTIQQSLQTALKPTSHTSY